MIRHPKQLLTQRKFPFIYCKFSNESNKNLPEGNITSKENKVDSEIVPQKYDQKSITKKGLQWRTPWHQKEGQHYSILRSFYREESHVSLTTKFQALTKYKSWRDFLAQSDEETTILKHMYIPERNQMLGNELALAHYIVSRGGAVKFVNENMWIKADKRGNYSLPRFCESDKFVEAIDCQDMDIIYEGLTNFRDLQEVKWLSFNGCKYIDDWCLDAIGNIFSETLVYLDLRDCPMITYKGLGALTKLNNLKILYLDDFFRNTTFELTCLLLQEIHPDLEIKSDVVTFEIPEDAR